MSSYKDIGEIEARRIARERGPIERKRKKKEEIGRDMERVILCGRLELESLL